MGKNNVEEKRSIETAEAARETEWTAPSFVGGLFMGRLHADLIFPFPQQSEEDRKQGDPLLKKVKEFLTKEVDADAIDRDKEIPKKVLDGFRKLGLFGIKLPKEYGGLDASLTDSVFWATWATVALICSEEVAMLWDCAASSSLLDATWPIATESSSAADPRLTPVLLVSPTSVRRLSVIAFAARASAPNSSCCSTGIF